MVARQSTPRCIRPRFCSPRSSGTGRCDGIPENTSDERSYQMTPEQRSSGRPGSARSMTHGPDRGDPYVGELIDFETTLPSAIEELIPAANQRQHALNQPTPRVRSTGRNLPESDEDSRATIGQAG